MIANGYPVELEELWQAGNERLLVRPIRPDDAAELDAFFDRLSPEEILFRFFTPIRQLKPEQLVKFTRLDYERDMALIAVQLALGDIVGVAQLIRGNDPKVAEFAVVIQHEFQGHGLAVHLMQRLLAWARQHGIREVVGPILARNTAMLELARFLGFHLAHLPAEPEIVEARLRLTSRNHGSMIDSDQ